MPKTITLTDEEYMRLIQALSDFKSLLEHLIKHGAILNPELDRMLANLQKQAAKT